MKTRDLLKIAKDPDNTTGGYFYGIGVSGLFEGTDGLEGILEGLLLTSIGEKVFVQWNEESFEEIEDICQINL